MVYKGWLRENARWCHDQGEDPIQAPLITVPNILGSLFKKGLSYSTICVYGSGIYSYHEQVETGAQVGPDRGPVSIEEAPI